MQAHRIAIRFTVPVTHGLTHQLRNYAEDLYRAFRNTRYATVENMDSAIDVVWVNVQSTGKLRTIRKVVEDCLADNLLGDRCEVLVDPAEGDLTTGCS
jgi:3-deoxy-D-manno-octulosonic-acid transferase